MLFKVYFRQQVVQRFRHQVVQLWKLCVCVCVCVCDVRPALTSSVASSQLLAAKRSQ